MAGLIVLIAIFHLPSLVSLPIVLLEVWLHPLMRVHAASDLPRLLVKGIPGSGEYTNGRMLLQMTLGHSWGYHPSGGGGIFCCFMPLGFFELMIMCMRQKGSYVQQPISV